jgi:hypothetical protein
VWTNPKFDSSKNDDSVFDSSKPGEPSISTVDGITIDRSGADGILNSNQKKWKKADEICRNSDRLTFETAWKPHSRRPAEIVVPLGLNFEVKGGE